MRKFLAGLAAGALALCAGCPKTPSSAPAGEWPAGSKVTGTICFEHETPDGWAPAQLHGPNGETPVKEAPVVGAPLFPMDAGQLRLRACQ